MSSPTSPVPVVCTVRGCGAPLAREERAWRCPRGHSYDVSRSGYVNLLQPHDRRSTKAGDSAEAVAARARLEERGVGQELLAALEAEVRRLGLPEGTPALDVGAGTGALAARLAHACGLDAWALDLATTAVDRGARRHPELAWVVANADRRLPFADGAFGLLTTCTGPKHPAEFRRVLAPRGALVVVVPADDDLIELRAALTGEGRAVDRVEPALAAFGEDFELQRRTTVRATHDLDRAALEDALAATYRGARHAERERAAHLERLPTTFAAEVLVLASRA